MSTAAIVHPFRRRRVRRTLRLIGVYTTILAASTLVYAPAATAGMHDGGAGSTDGWSWTG